MDFYEEVNSLLPKWKKNKSRFHKWKVEVWCGSELHGHRQMRVLMFLGFLP